MAAPEKLCIPYEDGDYGRFNAVGRLPNGMQFMAFVTGAFPSGMKYYSGGDWRSKKRWLAVIHRFSSDGTHIGTETRLGGLDNEGRKVAGDKAFAHLQEMYAELTASGDSEFGDIWVKLFSVEIDGITHGLFYEHTVEGEGEDRYEGEHVMLEPWDIMFHQPWDSGEYST